MKKRKWYIIYLDSSNLIWNIIKKIRETWERLKENIVKNIIKE